MDEKFVVSETILQELINDVEGIVSSKVKLDGNGNAIEIHALADKSRNAKQIVRDIQSAVMAKFGIDIDHRIISIAQLNCDNALPKELRLVFKSMEQVSKGLDLEVKVTLSHRDKDYTGSCKGINTSRNVGRIVAQSALQAVSEFMNFGEAFIVEDIRELKMASSNVVNVAITYIDRNGEQMLVGSSVVAGDTKEAIVKATLDAVNRRITKLMSR
ncbi:MAG: hypothetical protein HPY66_1483 [Firmicutes bacterium]|nr:hypothetical protein [Bacillota bacterium]MDI6707232.1 hypothetical protein [Bacillota bacterium]